MAEEDRGLIRLVRFEKRAMVVMVTEHYVAQEAPYKDERVERDIILASISKPIVPHEVHNHIQGIYEVKYSAKVKKQWKQ